MASRRVEEELEGLSRLRDAPAEEAVPALRKGLGSRINLIVAKAAKVAAERQFRVLERDLLRAYDRLFEKPVERDPQCWGKTAIAGALKDLEHAEAAPFLRGARHVQLEPAYGGHADSAEQLRATCLLALVACTDLERGEALRCFVNGLTEKSPAIRTDAVRALGQMAGDESALVLRLKARLGDEDTAVTGQVFDSLLTIEGDRALPFLADFLSRHDEVAEEAALALGSSRLDGAFDLLEKAWAGSRDTKFREVLLQAMSVTRLERAMDWLVNCVKSGRARDAVAALQALALHKGTKEIRRRVETAVESRDAELREAYRKLFAG